MKQRIAIIIGFLLQIVGVFAVLLPSVIALRTGTPATLRTVPIDPRSIFRGDYVVLGYEAGQSAPMDWEYGKPVYVVLAPKGDVYERVRLSETRPALLPGQICVWGTAEYGRIDFPDIGQFFVEEGMGRELENLQSQHRLLVDVAVAQNCRAAIKGVRIGPAEPATDPSQTSPLPVGEPS